LPWSASNPDIRSKLVPAKVGNGRHERMHLTLKKEATRPPGMNSLQQQARFEDFLKEFNVERAA
jgi:hypothetical protein